MANTASRNLFWIGAGALGGAALVRWQMARWFTRQPHYELEQRCGDLEIRTYGARWIAETSVSGATWEMALDEGFRRVAGYIFGDNRPSPFQPDRLAMPDAARPALATRVTDNGRAEPGYMVPMPVPTQPRRQPRSETIPMTVPVNVSTHDAGSYTIAFNLPEGRTLSSLPAPNDERVQIERRPRRRVAVTMFRGRATGPRIAQKFSELLASVRAAGLGYRGSPEFAGYDPPTTLPFLRHNEVWLELEAS